MEIYYKVFLFNKNTELFKYKYNDFVLNSHFNAMQGSIAKFNPFHKLPISNDRKVFRECIYRTL